MLENKQTIVNDIFMLSDVSLSPGQLCLIDDMLEIASSQKRHLFNSKCKGQHLYATTDEEINKGEWMLNLIGNPDNIRGWDLVQAKYNYAGKDNPWQMKIIATTNPELWYDKMDMKTWENTFNHAHKIPTTFLQPYVDAYNAGKPIKQVKLEQSLEFEDESLSSHNFNKEWKLKLKPNGAVTIHPVIEQKYSFEQMVDAILNNTSMTVEEAKEFVNQKYNR